MFSPFRLRPGGAWLEWSIAGRVVMSQWSAGSTHLIGASAYALNHIVMLQIVQGGAELARLPCATRRDEDGQGGAACQSSATFGVEL